jgi:hypothetical protein
MDTGLGLLEVTLAKVPVVTGTRTLLAHLAMDFSMTDGPPPASHNDNYVHTWLQDTAEVHPLLFHKIVCFVMSAFGGAHAAFRLMITCAVRHHGLLLRTVPQHICRPYLAARDRAIRVAVLRILGFSHDVHTLDQVNCAKRQLSLLAEFGWLYVPSLELDAKHAHFVSFTATLANMLAHYVSESLGPMYGFIREKRLHVAISTLPWAVHLGGSYDSISNMIRLSESDLVALTNTLN